MMVVFLSSTKIEELFAIEQLLQSKGISCDIKLESIQIHKFYTSPGAKLYINEYDLYDAQNILLKYGNNYGEATMNIGLEHSTEELKLKGIIRKLNDIEEINKLQETYKSSILSLNELEVIFKEEKNYIVQREKNKFDWNEFLTALFEGGFFKYLNRNKSTKYEIENELIRELDEDLD